MNDLDRAFSRLASRTGGYTLTVCNNVFQAEEPVIHINHANGTFELSNAYITNLDKGNRMHTVYVAHQRGFWGRLRNLFRR